MNIRPLTEEEKYDGKRLAMEVFLNSDGLGFTQQGMQGVFSFIEDNGLDLEYFGAYEKELVGILAYDPSNYHLALCFVRNDYQRQGIGHQLLQAFIEQAKKEHVAKITVNAAASAKEVYQKFGFEVCGEETDTDGVVSVPMEYFLGKENLGRTVHVTIDRPLGTMHEHLPDIMYQTNYGYVEECLSEDGEFQDAYVVGVNEPLETFEGIVVGLVYREDDALCRWIVAKDNSLKHDQIINEIAFQEQFYNTRIIWLED